MNVLTYLIYRYEGEDYPAAFAMGNDYYAHLIGKESDPLCKNTSHSYCYLFFDFSAK